MLCPYCNKEMREGNLVTPASLKLLSWVPKEYFNDHIFVPLTKQKVKDNGGVIINSESAFTGTPHLFYVCDDCGKIIGDIEK